MVKNSVTYFMDVPDVVCRPDFLRINEDKHHHRHHDHHHHEKPRIRRNINHY